MRLVTFVDGKGIEKIGIHTGELGRGTIIDIAQAALVVSNDLDGWKPPIDMISIIKTEDESLPQLQLIAQKAVQNELPKSVLHPENEITLISPLPRPTSMRDGYAFRQHVEAARRNRGVEMIPEFDHFPIFYFTNHLAVTGPGELPVQKLTLEKLDFELEASIVIGKGGKNISSAHADQHIFGYMVMNDWSARHLQMEEMKLNLGPAKGKDFATSLGPYLVTRDELSPFSIPGPQGERHNLKMKCWVNGKLVSEGNLKDMTWTFAQIVERASYGVHLYPGEVIGSGTVGTGCFLELNGSKITDNQWLKAGDEVVMEIENLGRLVNTVRDAEPTPLDQTLPR
jgi:fumarylacetoacetate (FAA) hydrolase